MSKSKRTAEQQAFLNELASLWPLARGSLAEVRKPCIRPDCRTCREGRKHKAIIFGFTQGGKRRCRYVPADLAPVLREALANGRRLGERLADLGADLIDRYRQNRSRNRG
jgi:hypothetical protein